MDASVILFSITHVTDATLYREKIYIIQDWSFEVEDFFLVNVVVI
jgi:hypothetical protein